jgi:hypothetical protein
MDWIGRRIGGFARDERLVEVLRDHPAGFGNVSANTTSGAGSKIQTSTTNKASLSMVVGYIVTFSSTTTFQAGLLAGVDWAGSGQYQYNGKPWIGISRRSNLTK